MEIYFQSLVVNVHAKFQDLHKLRTQEANSFFSKLERLKKTYHEANILWPTKFLSIKIKTFEKDYRIVIFTNFYILADAFLVLNLYTNLEFFENQNANYKKLIQLMFLDQIFKMLILLKTEMLILSQLLNLLCWKWFYHPIKHCWMFGLLYKDEVHRLRYNKPTKCEKNNCV